MLPSAPFRVSPQQATAFEFADAHADDYDLRWAMKYGRVAAWQHVDSKGLAKLPSRECLSRLEMSSS